MNGSAVWQSGWLLGGCWLVSAWFALISAQCAQLNARVWLLIIIHHKLNTLLVYHSYYVQLLPLEYCLSVEWLALNCSALLDWQNARAWNAINSSWLLSLGGVSSTLLFLFGGLTKRSANINIHHICTKQHFRNSYQQSIPADPVSFITCI
jgi:hypothetical protein